MSSDGVVIIEFLYLKRELQTLSVGVGVGLVVVPQFVTALSQRFPLRELLVFLAHPDKS